METGTRGQKVLCRLDIEKAAGDVKDGASHDQGTPSQKRNSDSWAPKLAYGKLPLLFVHLSQYISWRRGDDVGRCRALPN